MHKNPVNYKACNYQYETKVSHWTLSSTSCKQKFCIIKTMDGQTFYEYARNSETFSINYISLGISGFSSEAWHFWNPVHCCFQIPFRFSVSITSCNILCRTCPDLPIFQISWTHRHPLKREEAGVIKVSWGAYGLKMVQETVLSLFSRLWKFLKGSWAWTTWFLSCYRPSAVSKLANFHNLWGFHIIGGRNSLSGWFRSSSQVSVLSMCIQGL